MKNKPQNFVFCRCHICNAAVRNTGVQTHIKHHKNYQTKDLVIGSLLRISGMYNLPPEKIVMIMQEYMMKKRQEE